MSHFGFTPPRPSNVRCTQTARKKEENQALPLAAMQQKLLSFPVTCYVGNPAAFHTEEANGQYSHCGLPADFTGSHFACICIRYHQSSESLLTLCPHTPTRAQKPHQQPSQAFEAT